MNVNVEPSDVQVFRIAYEERDDAACAAEHRVRQLEEALRDLLAATDVFVNSDAFVPNVDQLWEARSDARAALTIRDNINTPTPSRSSHGTQ